MKEAPDVDGILEYPDMFRSLLQKHLEVGSFSDTWKVQKQVLLLKPRKRPGDPVSYRPSCSLDTLLAWPGKGFNLIHLSKECQPGLVLEIKRNCGKLNNVFRAKTMRVASAYRTISMEAVCLISGMKRMKEVLQQ